MCVSHGKEVAALHPTLSNYISVLEFSGIAASGASLCGSEIMPAAAVRDSEVMPAAIHEKYQRHRPRFTYARRPGPFLVILMP